MSSPPGAVAGLADVSLEVRVAALISLAEKYTDKA